jgi:hypothetical protein
MRQDSGSLSAARGGRTDRRVGNANHNPDQVFYYDENFMQRRMDYSPYVTGSPPVAHYTHDPKTFDGFVFPTRRRVHHYDAAGVADQSSAAITIDSTTSRSPNEVRTSCLTGLSS